MTSIKINFDPLRSTNPVKIYDLAHKSLEGKYSEEECLIRRKLACVYRLIDLFGWSQGIDNHNTCRIPGEENHFLINPYGILYHEITASNLIKIGHGGKIMDHGTSGFGINYTGYVIHSAIFGARKDVNCIIHMHGIEAMAASCLKDAAFLPVSQEGCVLGHISVHEFWGSSMNTDEQEAIVKDLGETNVMVLRSHGVVVCGPTMEITLCRAFYFMLNAQVQAFLTGVPSDRIVLPSAKAQEICRIVTEEEGVVAGADKWETAELEWEAWMRCLDRMGLNTGHQYRNPNWKDW